MMHRVRQRTVIVALGMVLSSIAFGAAPAVATDLVVDLEGRAIPSTQASVYDCHDLDYPKIHCFRTSAELDSALATRGVGPLATAATSGIAYIRVWEDASYQGNTILLSSPYPSLGAIGWNDKITSFQAQNSRHGEFYEHNNYAGFVYGFCCNSQVTNVGNFYNDKFSSVKDLT